MLRVKGSPVLECIVMAMGNKLYLTAGHSVATAGSMACLEYFPNVVVESSRPTQVLFSPARPTVYIQSKCQPSRHPRHAR